MQKNMQKNPPEDKSHKKYYPYIGTGHIQLTNGYWYFGETGGANEIVDSLQPGNPAGVDRITEVVNKYTDTYGKREDAYRDLIKVINE